jgi:hypothetical protein
VRHTDGAQASGWACSFGKDKQRVLVGQNEILYRKYAIPFPRKQVPDILSNALFLSLNFKKRECTSRKSTTFLETRASA